MPSTNESSSAYLRPQHHPQPVDTTPRRIEGQCLYCGRFTQGKRTCGYCAHLPWLDPWLLVADQWAEAR